MHLMQIASTTTEDYTMNNAGLKLMATLAVALVEVGAASAEPEGISIGNEVVQPQLSFLQLDASSLSTAFDASGISSYKCKSALKEFQKTVDEANLAAASHREKIIAMMRAYLRTCIAKAQEAGDLDRVVALEKAFETADVEVVGDLEEIAKLREGRRKRLIKIDYGLVTTGLNAAQTFNGVLEWQKKETTRKGDIEEAKRIATFQNEIKNWAVATRDCVPRAHESVRAMRPVPQLPATRPSEPVKDVKPIEPTPKIITINARSDKGAPLGKVNAGDSIEIRYVSGKWASDKGHPTTNPDETRGVWAGLVLIKLDKDRTLLAKIPTHTKDNPFVYVVDEEDAGHLALRIEKHWAPETCVGSVRYEVKIIPKGGKAPDE